MRSGRNSEKYIIEPVIYLYRFVTSGSRMVSNSSSRDDVTCPSGVSSLSMLSVDAACAYLFSLTLLVLDKRTGKNGVEFLIGWCDYPNLIDDTWEPIAGQRT